MSLHNSQQTRKVVLGLTLVALPLSAAATNGLYQHGYSIKDSALAGSGMALPQDALAAASNPAGMVFVDDRFDIGLSWFSPMRDYTVVGPPSGGFPPLPGPTVESGSENFVIPTFGWKRSVGERGAFGISVYGNGGMNTDWDANDTPSFPTPVGTFNGTFLAGDTGVDYMQLFANVSYSRKFGENASWGIGGILNYSRLEMRGIQSFAPFSVEPNKLSDNGHDDAFGVGAIASIHGKVAPNLSLSAAYQSEVKNEFDEYSGLFAKGGELNIPAWVGGGLAWEPNDRSALTFAVQHIFYEDVEAIGNDATGDPNGGLFACGAGDVSRCLGAGKDATGFGWNDMTIYKIGYQWDTANDWTWRVGFSTGDQPIPKDEVTFNIIAPGVMEEHLTFGFTKALEKDRELSVGLMYAPEVCQKGPSAFNPGQTIELCMDQFRLDVGFSF